MSLTSRRTVMARKRYKPEESLNANGGSATEQQCHFVRALRSNGQERASGERHAVEDDQDPLQSPYAPKREPAQPAVEGDFAEDATHRESEGLREHLERRAIDINEPSLFSHDATGGGQQELERLAASVRAGQRAEAAARVPLAAPLAPMTGPAPPDGGFGLPPALRPGERQGVPDACARWASDV